MIRILSISWLLAWCLMPLAHAQKAPKAVPVADPAPAATPAPKPPKIPASSQSVPGYRLKPNDVVRLSVFEEPDLSTSTRILKTGEAVFPLIGTVHIAGTSLAEATERVRLLYAADYLVDPKVTLSVDEYATDYISIVGAVNRPGQIPIPSSGRFDLASALATAGGLAQNADPNRITLVRASGGRSVFSENQIRNNGGIPLRSGDRIVVAESRFIKSTVTVMGQVRRPGPIEFPLDGKLDLLTAIARAGGFTDLASPKKVKVTSNGRTTVVDMRAGTEHHSKNFTLHPNDIITVPERWL